MTVRNRAGVRETVGSRTAGTRPTALRALGYARVSTHQQADGGAGLEAQRVAVVGEAERRGWHLVELIEDAGQSSATLERPGIRRALDLLEQQMADVLLVAKLDRLTRSLRDFGELAERARKRRWALVCLDLGVDTTTPAGELVAGVVASTAQYERRLIGQRTREALAARRAAGVRLGRPARLGQDTVDRIVELRAAGLSLRGICAALQAAGVPTAGGGAWSPSSVQGVLRSQAAIPAL